MRGDIFSLFFQLFQFDQITVETLYNGHLRDIEESGHSREVERRVNVSHVWTVRRKKNNKTKMARVERWPLRKKHLILTEINEGILLSIEGYCVCRDRYAVFRKLPHSRKLYLCMNSASRIFFSASFLSVYEVVRTTKKNLRGWLVYIAHQHRTPNEWSKKLCELVSGHKRLTKNSAGNKLLLGIKLALYDNLTKPLLVA